MFNENSLPSLFADGGARGNPVPAGAGVVLFSAEGKKLAERQLFLGKQTNNRAEWFAAILALRLAKEEELREFRLLFDSKLVAEQLAGRWKVKNPGLAPLAAAAKKLVENFARVEIEHLPREKNAAADALANAAMNAGAPPFSEKEFLGKEEGALF